MSKKWYNKKLNNLLYNKEWKRKAKKRRQDIFKVVDSLPFVKRKFTSGSFARKTNLPGSDIDIFVEVDQDYFQKDIHKAQNKIYAALQQKWPNNSIRPQPHTIGVILDEIKFELIPAFRKGGIDQYEIPEGQNTIITNPYKTKNRVKKINGATRGLFSHNTRIIKYWKKQNEIPLPSFYLELLILEKMEARLDVKRNPDSFAIFFYEISSKIKQKAIPNFYSGKLSLLNYEQQILSKKLRKSKRYLEKYQEKNDTKYLKLFFNLQ